MESVNNKSINDELVNIPVPRRFYPLLIRTLADALRDEVPAEVGMPIGERTEQSNLVIRPWTSDEIRLLNRLVTNPTARAVMDLTCVEAGRRISFNDARHHAKRSFGQGRADLAGFTRLIRQRFDRSNWPIHIEQGEDGRLIYDAAPDVAAAWTTAK